MPPFTCDASWSFYSNLQPSRSSGPPEAVLEDTKTKNGCAREEIVLKSLFSAETPTGQQVFLTTAPPACSRLQDSLRVTTEQELGREGAPSPDREACYIFATFLLSKSLPQSTLPQPPYDIGGLYEGERPQVD